MPDDTAGGKTGDDTGGRPVKSGRWVLVAAIAASAMAFIDRTALNVALPAMQKTLEVSGGGLLWIVNAYNVTLASLMLAGGALGDVLGRKRVFMTGVFIFAAASIGCGFSPATPVLIMFRTLEGIGAGLMIPGSLALITSSFGSDRRGRAIGTWAAGTTIATILGPLVGGLFADMGFWRGIFFINVPFAVLSLTALFLKVPESLNEQSSRRIDYPGAILAFAGLAGLSYGLIVAPDAGFGSVKSYAPLAGGILAFGAFIFAERRHPNPLVPLRLFASRTFTGANLLTLLLYAALNAYSLFLNLNLIQAQGYPETLAGLASLPFAVLLATISRGAGRLVERFGPRLPLIAGPAVVSVSLFLHSLIGLTAGPSAYWTTFFPVVALFGIGMGLTVAPLTTTVMNAAEEGYAGTASGINNAVSRIAGVLAIAVTGSVALFSFTGTVDHRVEGMGLSRNAAAAVKSEAAKLGDAEVPATVGKDRRAEVEKLYTLSFVDTYRLIMRISAVLAGLSVFGTVFLIRRDPAQSG